MSQEKVEQLYRAVVELWNGRDLEGALALIDDDVVISTALGGVEGGYHGQEGVRRWWDDFHDVFPDCHVNVLALRTISDATIAQIRITGHGGGSGTPLDVTMWHAMRWRDGRVWRLSDRLSEAEAIEAVGLSE